MMNKQNNFFIYVCLPLLLLLPGRQGRAQNCIDTNATPATRQLYKNLLRLQATHTLFGQQDALAYGVGWKYQPGRSDIYSLVKDRPAIYGWDVGLIEMDSAKNLDGVPFERMKKYIKEGYSRGAVITISWHLRNPFTGGNAWDTTAGSLASVLPGGSKHALFTTWLDKLAVFLSDLKDDNHQMIPILFRPYHELTGNWFWWCSNNASPQQFIQLWQFTINYLKNKKQLHHLLYVYNTASFKNEAHFWERYPGDDYADVLSFDMYQHGAGAQQVSYKKNMRRQLLSLSQMASTKQKIAALAETGYEAIPDAHWWTQTLWPLLKGLPISYVLVWRNEGYMPQEKKMHYYAPYPGQVSARDFKKFYRNKRMLFEKKAGALKLYIP